MDAMRLHAGRPASFWEPSLREALQFATLGHVAAFLERLPEEQVPIRTASMETHSFHQVGRHTIGALNVCVLLGSKTHGVMAVNAANVIALQL